MEKILIWIGLFCDIQIICQYITKIQQYGFGSWKFIILYQQNCPHKTKIPDQ